MVTPEDITKILIENVNSSDLEFCKELQFLYPRAYISRVWMAGTCFLFTRPINGTRKVHAFIFDMKSVINEYPENLISVIKQSIKIALKDFENKLLGKINRQKEEIKPFTPTRDYMAPQLSAGPVIPRGLKIKKSPPKKSTK